MGVFIYICILGINLIAVFLTYHFLGKDMDKKQKGIFIVVGVAVIYMLVTFVYWISTKNIDLGVSSDNIKNLIIFTFVPVNAMITLPFLASSYKHFRKGDLKPTPFRNRCILIGIVLAILLIGEFFYFQDIQTGILQMIQSAQSQAK